MEKFGKIVETIARENGIAPQEVLGGMQQAIDLAYEGCDASVRPLWEGMIFQTQRPTPEELVLQLALLLEVGKQRQVQ